MRLSVLGYGPLFLAAIWKRRSARTHKRLMLPGTIVLISAAFGRMFPGPVGILVLPDLFLLALVAWDPHARPASLVG